MELRRVAISSVLVFVFIVTAFSVSVGTVKAVDGVWTDRQPLPALRSDGSTAVCGGKIYYLGGYSVSFPYSIEATLYAYSPSSNAWTTLASIPDNPCHTYAAQMCSDGSKLYVWGGLDSQNHMYNDLRIYDPARDRWTTGSGIPGITGIHSGSCIYDPSGGKIYIIGGCRNTSGVVNYSPRITSYAPSNGQYVTTLNDMPSPKAWFASGLISGKIYCIGGGVGGLYPGNTNYEYTISTNQWVTKTPLPVNRWGLAREEAVLSGMVMVYSGMDTLGFHTTCHAYSPALDSFQTLDDGMHPRDGHSAATIGNQVYFVGGRDQTTFPIPGLNYNEQLHLAGALWTPKQPLPAPRADGCTAVCGGKIYFLGGYSVNSPMTVQPDLYSYDPSTNSWTTLAPVPDNPCHTYCAQMCSDNNKKLYVWGGLDSNNNMFKDLRIYDTSRNRWSTGPDIPGVVTGIHSASCIYDPIGGKIYIIGGCTGTGYSPKIISYNPSTGLYDTTLQDMPHLTQPGKAWFATGLISGKIYCIGGGPGIPIGDDYTTSYEYTISTNQWTTKTPLPASRWGLAREPAVINGMVIVYAGMDGSGTFYTTCYAYNPVNDQFLTLSNGIYARDGLSAATLNNQVYFIGGRARTAFPIPGVIYNEQLTYLG